MEQQVCVHIKQITSLKEPKEYVCEECIKTGDEWLHLRTCQTCGVNFMLRQLTQYAHD